MTDERLKELLDDAARTYRVPPEPDLAAIWSDVAEEAFSDHPRWRRPWTRSPSWRVFSVAMAATLILGVGLGRFISRAHTNTGATIAQADPTPPDAVPAAYDRTATELLGRTALLLSTLPAEGGPGGADRRFTDLASELLTTTRLLLDSPAASDPRFKELLQDLELILAQISRLKGARAPEEMELITDALSERNVVPRIHSAVARLSLGDD